MEQNVDSNILQEKLVDAGGLFGCWRCCWPPSDYTA
jgi:hypothetical protein